MSAPENSSIDLLDKADALLMECAEFSSSRLSGESIYLSKRIGTIEAICEHVCNDESLEVSERIEEILRRTEIHRENSLKIAMLYSPTEQRRQAQAEAIFQRYSSLVSQNTYSSNKYLMIASGTALVTGLTAISNAWEHKEFVSIVSQSIMYYFIPALILSSISDNFFKISDANRAEGWQLLTFSPDKDSREKHERLTNRASAHNKIAAAIQSIGYFVIACGVIHAADKIVSLAP